MFSSEAQASGYLAGMIDGEGCVSFDEKHGRCAVRIANTDRGIIDACVAACDVLELRCSVQTRRTPSSRPCWIVYMGGRANLRKLASQVQLRSPKKVSKLAGICANEPKRRHWHPDDYPVEEVCALYLAGVSTREVAKQVGVGSQTVQRWLERANISRRQQGRAKYSDDDVAAIRAAVAGGMSQAEVCRRFGIAVSTCSMIVNHKMRTKPYQGLVIR